MRYEPMHLYTRRCNKDTSFALIDSLSQKKKTRNSLKNKNDDEILNLVFIPNLIWFLPNKSLLFEKNLDKVDK